MNEILHEKINNLNNELKSHPDVIELDRLEKILNNDEEVMKLCYRKDVCVTKYEDAIRYFGENSDETLEAQKFLHQAKLALDENELVKKYNEQYKKVRKLYDKINEEIFDPFK